MLPVSPRRKGTCLAKQPPLTSPRCTGGLLYSSRGPMHLKPTTDNTIVLKSAREIAIMRETGNIVAAAIRSLEDRPQPGVSTRDLDQVAVRMFNAARPESPPLGYIGSP